ncbi:PREDICTED: uncharacterized protein LOC108370086 isoform X1 [Rhagoletis zephyria]|uniref:uncharacterized protein LOC108370086 isoform X1 n=1 Tax=Rhagoletis zephyria TaxID=28612 RepID=UPI000811421A|nr:PREDICTED: uncharacterized protein LOC108370086 isoform X1 [Rhagoletis zephyria]
MEAHGLCFYIILFCIVSNRHAVLCTHEEDSWIEPDAWGREQSLRNSHQKNDLENGESTSDSKCNVIIGSSHSTDTVTLMYYKRLIAYLFNNDSLKYDKETGKYSRAIILTVLPGQLERLTSLNDPRDLDSVLTQILTKAREPNQDDCYYCNGRSGYGSMGIFDLIWDIIKDVAQLLKASEVQFLLGAAGLVMIGWYCHRKYNIGIISMIIGAVICFGYFHTYLECNRKLEAERLLEMLARHEQQEPSEPSWYRSIVNFFTSSEQREKQAKKEYIKQSSQLNLGFCRPDHVFLMYANDLFLKQLGFLMDKCAETMEVLKDNLTFPFNYLASVLLVVLIGYIVKLTFKYILSPRAWAGVWQAPQIGIRTPHHNGLPTGTAHHEDRLSGENLRMLLNAISGGTTTSNKITISNTTVTAPLTESPETTSGVQEILLSLENGSNADTASDESSMSEAAAQKSKHNSPHKQVDETDNNNGVENQFDVSDDGDKSKTVNGVFCSTKKVAYPLPYP